MTLKDLLETIQDLVEQYPESIDGDVSVTDQDGIYSSPVEKFKLVNGSFYVTCETQPIEPPLDSQIKADNERIARAGADFFQNGDFENWKSPTGRVFDDLANGWQVGYDLMKTIITKSEE